MQDLLAILIVAIAAGFLIRRAWQRIARRQSGACGSCSNCGAADSLKSKPLVTIMQIMSHAETQGRREEN